uniref:ribose-phosphate diphosphokinase n=1 Tax=Palpitomonas bilix TaxID=652834 RepID=A0A7S3DDW8_9EUKA|mmetsp:Transcript_32832/g.84801  ORF Transcript_32832/g.84801 Transcript_32832/m.84801 type:complete len:386 (+) Transcript_32832:112-1269(+)
MAGAGVVLVAGNGNIELAKEISDYLDTPLIRAEISKFSDGETRVQLLENVRGSDAYVIQSTCPPASDTVMELLIIVDALKRASARRINAVIPYYAYGRQDQKVADSDLRSSIPAKLFADLLSAAGIHRMITVDVHAGQIQGFFDIPVDNLTARFNLIREIKLMHLRNLVVVSPDSAGMKRAGKMAESLNVPLAYSDCFSSDGDGGIVVGDVAGKACVIFDDLVITGTRLTRTAALLKQHGAIMVIGCVVHFLQNEESLKKISHGEVDRLIVTNTVPIDPLKFREITSKEERIKLGLGDSDSEKRTLSKDDDEEDSSMRRSEELQIMPHAPIVREESNYMMRARSKSTETREPLIVTHVTVAALLGESIRRTHNEEKVSTLFDDHF